MALGYVLLHGEFGDSVVYAGGGEGYGGAQGQFDLWLSYSGCRGGGSENALGFGGDEQFCLFCIFTIELDSVVSSCFTALEPRLLFFDIGRVSFYFVLGFLGDVFYSR